MNFRLLDRKVMRGIIYTNKFLNQEFILNMQIDK